MCLISWLRLATLDLRSILATIPSPRFSRNSLHSAAPPQPSLLTLHSHAASFSRKRKRETGKRARSKGKVGAGKASKSRGKREQEETKEESSEEVCSFLLFLYYSRALS